MNCYVINMEGATHRWQHIKEEFARAGIQPIRFAGRTARDFPPHFFRWTLNTFLAEGWTEGELGCLLSHLSIWEQLVTHNLPCAAIFEDDVVLGIGAKEALESMAFADRATIKKLETWFQPCFISREPIQSMGKNNYFRLLSQHRGAAGYALNQAAAKELLAMMAATPSRADVLTFTPSMMRGRVVIDQLVPAVVIQQMFLSRQWRNPLLKSTLSEERSQKAIDLKLNFTKRIFRRLIKTSCDLVIYFSGRKLVIPYRDSTGRLIKSPAKS